jgi:hypothetical protein
MSRVHNSEMLGGSSSSAWIGEHLDRQAQDAGQLAELNV